MKESKEKMIKSVKIMLVLLVMLSSSLTNAQPGFGDDVQDNGDAVPLDGGLTALLIGAAAFGVKKLRDIQKK